MNAEQLLAFFEQAPLTVALGELIAEAHAAGDQPIEGFLLEELEEAMDNIHFLNTCFALEAA